MMKKALVISFFLVSLSLPSFAQTQEQGDARFHGFGTYGLRWKEFGVGGGIEFFFVDHFAIMPSVTSYFPNVGNRTNFSADFRYYISEGPSQLYFLIGYSQNWENTQPGNPGIRRTNKGANVGVGAYIRVVEWVGLSTEFRFQSTSPQEAGFRVGLAFPL
ncbi:hypothetical protein [Algoriphagus limi]|uniref:Outer membrane protein beta-barrel domain-containing protein n=1 Tax=Algoriphagus limi TaxID=2975273 RepID=A0ABT2G8B2_9BACT|nr:hypothetical protein [Algoriphagus limi]MCS5491509.1 hypothetical protein [Algoriphagus limi]